MKEYTQAIVLMIPWVMVGRLSVSYNDSFDQELESNANYAFVVNTQNNIIEIPRTGTCPSCGK